MCFYLIAVASPGPASNVSHPVFLKPLSGINKREAKDCHHIRHFENTFVVETVICDGA